MRLPVRQLCLTLALLVAPALARHPESVEMGGRNVWVWRPSGAGPHPVVVFSHGMNASGTQSRFLTEALAKRGYLVLAPDHRDGGRPRQPLREPGAWTDGTYRERAGDVRAVLDALRAEPWSKLADRSRLALAGHSLGGYTALALAGAWPSWKLPGVRAVLALSPYAQPFLGKKTLGSLTVPVMYQGGTLDAGITPWIARRGGAYDQTPSPSYFVSFRRAGHFAFTDLRSAVHDDVVAYAAAFLDRHVKGDAGADPAKRRGDPAELRAK